MYIYIYMYMCIYIHMGAAVRHGRGPVCRHVRTGTLNLRTTTSQKCEAVPRRARI